MKLGIFEDTLCYNLRPVNHLRHTAEIINGANSLIDKIRNYKNPKIDKEIILLSRPEIKPLLKHKFPEFKINELTDEDHVFINARMKYDRNTIDFFIASLNTDKDYGFITEKEILIVHFSKDTINKLREMLEGMNSYLLDKDIIDKLDHYHAPVSKSYKLIEYPWDNIISLEEDLNRDLEHLFKTKKKNTKDQNSRAFNKKNIFVGKNCNIYPNVILDADKGRVFIDDNVTIEPFVYIHGPAYIGKNSVLKSGTVLYGPVTISDSTKVNGEISSSIFHSFSNKQHLGFLGHSYICEWVNLGAGTTTSNLKNNYSEITIKTKDGDIETNSIFLGSIIGDHTKTSINTILNTGSIIGVSCNIFGSAFHDKLIRSFSWDDSDSRHAKLYEIDKALNTARISMKRRNVEMNDSYENTLRELYKKIDSLNI